MRPSEVVRTNVARLRREHKLSAAALSKITKELGAPISRGTIANIESGVQRSTTVDQLFVLALALDVAPATLITPPPTDDELRVTDTVTTDVSTAQEWIVGLNP